MKSGNPGRPKIKGARHPYPSPPKVTQTQKAIKGFMKRIKRGRG